MFLTHDPARQFASPYAYGPWDPVNGTDPTGSVFGLDDLVIAILAGALVGAIASAIQAAMQGATPIDSVKAAAVGAGTGAAGAWVGATVVSPFIDKVVVPHLANAFLAGGMDARSALLTAKLAATGTFVAGNLTQVGYAAYKGDYTGVASLGLTVGVLSAIAGSFYGGLSSSLGGIFDFVDALLTGERPLPGSPPYLSLQEGVDKLANTEVRGDLARKLATGEITVFENRMGKADAFTIAEHIWVSKAALRYDAATRAVLLGHEYFHVLYNRTFGVRALLGSVNEAYADFFGARVAGLGGAPYLGDPGVFFNDIVGGYYNQDPLLRFYLRLREK